MMSAYGCSYNEECQLRRYCGSGRWVSGKVRGVSFARIESRSVQAKDVSSQ